MLNHNVYETLRWLIAIVLPALGLLLVTIDNIWQLGLPAEEISLTLDAIGLFLGSIFGISKVKNDKKKKKVVKK